MVFNSIPIEFTQQSVIREAGGAAEELPNDSVWGFAGGVAPKDFLKKIGVELGSREVTLEVVQQAGAALVGREARRRGTNLTLRAV